MPICVALVTGGDNKEREISHKSAATFIQHLSQEKYKITVFDIPSEYRHFVDDIENFDVVIPVIHGIGGEDGSITTLCEQHTIPYFFTAATSHALCIDKLSCGNIVSEGGFIVPRSVIVKNSNDVMNKSLDGKLFVKPVHGGSSVDSGVFDNREAANELMSKIIVYDSALVQEYVTGRELTVSIDGDYNKSPKVLAISEIMTGQEFFDYDAKYSLKNTKEVTPAKLDTTLQKYIEDIAIGIYKECKIQCLGRIDFIYTPETNTLYFLEINTIPGFTETSFFPQAIKHNGLSISEYLDTKIGDILENIQQ